MLWKGVFFDSEKAIDVICIYRILVTYRSCRPMKTMNRAKVQD